MDVVVVVFFSSRRRHTRWPRDWSSDVCSSDLVEWARRAPLGRGARLEVRRIHEESDFDDYADHERSEERRVGKECRSGGWAGREEKKRNTRVQVRTTQERQGRSRVLQCSNSAY